MIPQTVRGDIASSFPAMRRSARIGRINIVLIFARESDVQYGHD